MNATRTLLREMMLDTECADFIKGGWLSLYLDIVANVGKEELSTLDEISRFALLDWYEFKENRE